MRPPGTAETMIDIEATPAASTTRLTPPPLPPAPEWTPSAPSLSLLFSYLTRRDVVNCLFPAIIVSMVSGGVAPFMTRVIGQMFNTLAVYPQSTLPPEQAKHKLLHDMGISAVELIGLAAGTLLLSSLMANLWMWVGERNAQQLRKAIFTAVTSREMEWFDLKMGQDEQNEAGSGDKQHSDTGAGGLMAKFSRETDDIRQATAINTGMLIQYATTFLACLILALIESWSLTLVILSSIPLLVFIQGLCQGLATPFYNIERNRSSATGTRIERAVTSIATVKAFNAQRREIEAVSRLLQAGKSAYAKCAAIWGVTAGITQFILFAMFVQGFWYGSKLVREGKITPGNVMAVFWACLIASSNLQLCIPLLVILTKGKAAMVSVDTLIKQPMPSKDSQPAVHSPTSRVFSPLNRHSRPHSQTMMKVIPQGRCHGAFALHNVRFAYPSRPTVRVLSIDDVYLPSGETTFIVGSSGSGKSTIAQLLLRLYDLSSPGSGTILFDDNDLAYLDATYTRQHIASVSQTCILFDMTVHENVEMGLKAAGSRNKTATREEVERACRTALMHEFVRDLPEGYDTRLGTGGASLSGGQRQRLAIARAMLRDPTVLILDEATSALDATSRVLVTEAIKAWRKNKTTIVITHDLTQIGPEDFVYVLKNGEVVEQGYRAELEKGQGVGEFRRMGEAQLQQNEDGTPNTEADTSASDFFYDAEDGDGLEDGVHAVDVMNTAIQGASNVMIPSFDGAALSRAPSTSEGPHGHTKWMFDAIADLTVEKPSDEVHEAAHVRASQYLAPENPTLGRKASLKKKLSIIVQGPGSMRKSRTSFQLARPAPSAFKTTGSNTVRHVKRSSLQFEPLSPPAEKTSMWSSAREKSTDVEDDDEFQGYKDAMRATGAVAGEKRHGPQGALRIRKSQNELAAAAAAAQLTVDSQPVPSLTATTRRYFPTVPNKALIFLGVTLCVINGIMTPVFSVTLAQLMSLVGSGATDVHGISLWGKIVLMVALADGLTAGLKFFVMEHAAMAWVAKLRDKAYNLVLSQDKTYFDDPDHSPSTVVQIIVKDGDDTRTLVATVLPQTVVVITMISVGLIWALIRGWQLTLVGFAIAPVFGAAMMGQSVLMGKFERRSKRAREQVEKRYFETISSIRAIRSMAMEEVFVEMFEKAVDEALVAGVKGSFVAGTGYGVANGLVYLAQAVLFYFGGVMMAKGTYSYLTMLEVLNLVVFTISIAGQVMAFVPRIAKANQAASDFDKLLSLETTKTDESYGSLRYPIRGDIAFKDVAFAYSQRSDVPVLKHLSFTIQDGECVAIVGASGSGKSTIAALLQRLYEPSSGSVTFGNRFQLKDADVVWLRSHIAVVSQHAALFDASIKENILYGLESDSVPFSEVQRAARDANLDTVIAGLPDGYDTVLGENAALISGGQAQRIQLARALVNGKANVLILDEFTSALDVDNQESLMNTVMNLKQGRTTIIVTHKLPVMRRCDRILVVKDGSVVEQGSYDTLMGSRGHFFTLASAGEWAD